MRPRRSRSRSRRLRKPSNQIAFNSIHTARTTINTLYIYQYAQHCQAAGASSSASGQGKSAPEAQNLQPNDQMSSLFASHSASPFNAPHRQKKRAVLAIECYLVSRKRGSQGNKACQWIINQPLDSYNHLHNRYDTAGYDWVPSPTEPYMF